MAKTKKVYPLLICGGCAEQYASLGFRVEYAKPREMVTTESCSLCFKHVPVYRARLTGAGRRGK